MELSEVKRVLNLDHQIFDGPQDNEYTGAIKTAIESFLRAQEVQSWVKWNEARRVIAAKQLVCKLAGIDPGPIDGVIGHLTDRAIAQYDNGGAPLPEPPPIQDPVAAAPVSSAKWPRQTPDRGEIIAFFGKVGTRQVKLQLPYPLYFGPTKLATIGCHELVREPVRRILTNVFDHYGGEDVKRLRLDQFSGSLNVRKITGGSAWSMHAWGIAFDFDAAHNGYMQHCKTSVPKPTFCGPEYKFWIDAWEAEGAVSLGKSRDFDWMHFQFARLA